MPRPSQLKLETINNRIEQKIELLQSIKGLVNKYLVTTREFPLIGDDALADLKDKFDLMIKEDPELENILRN